MYRMLIVDDEPAIVEGLAQLFEECGMELDVWKATSADEALHVARRMKLDLVLSDIRMPEKNGLQLMDEILLYWPSCKILFLTGYSDFDYAYEAFQKNVETYLLKHEDDSKVLAAVQAVVLKLEDERKNGELLARAMAQAASVQPLVRKSYLDALMSGEPMRELQLLEPFYSLPLELRKDVPVMLLAGFVRKWSGAAAYGSKLHACYGVQAIFREMLTTLLAVEELVYERSALVWLIQPNPEADRLTLPDRSPDWRATASYLKGILESVQNLCQETLDVEVTFVLSRDGLHWDEIHREFETMRSWMRQQDWLAPHMTIIDMNAASAPVSERTWKRLSDSGQFDRQMQQLEQALRDGDETEAERLCRLAVSAVRRDLSGSYTEGARNYLRLALLYLTQACEGEMPDSREGEPDISRLFAFEVPDDWLAEEGYFIRLGAWICAGRRKRSEAGEYALIDKIHQFIDGHLGEDLSLIRLAGVAFMNPSYFSRFYKQRTGRNVSEYIHAAKLQAAKALLEDGMEKVQDIAQQLGFASASYFSIFFRKMTGMTPQDYRERL